jgi:hypothetical protein
LVEMPSRLAAWAARKGFSSTITSSNLAEIRVYGDHAQMVSL